MKSMTQKKRNEIKRYIFQKYTGMTVLECLSIEYPDLFRYYYEKNVKNKGDDE